MNMDPITYLSNMTNHDVTIVPVVIGVPPMSVAWFLEGKRQRDWRSKGGMSLYLMAGQETGYGLYEVYADNDHGKGYGSVLITDDPANGV